MVIPKYLDTLLRTQCNVMCAAFRYNLTTTNKQLIIVKIFLLQRNVFCYLILLYRVSQKYKFWIIGIDSQYNSRGSHLRAQLSNVITMLPTVQMHLILCTFFTSTANKHEFITMAYQLIDRLAALNHLTYPLR